MSPEPIDAPTEVEATAAGAGTARAVPDGAADGAGPAHPSDADAEGGRRSRGRRRSRVWLEGGSSVRRWGYDLLGWAILSFGAGVLASSALRAFVPTSFGAMSADLVLWLGMIVPVILAFARSRPRMLLRFRWLDVLYGVVLGGVLRIIQGWLEVAAGASGAFPSYPTVNGNLVPGWWFTDALVPVVIGPTVEEFFFRGVLLVVIYTVVRRAFGRGFAGFIALVLTTGAFVTAHAISGPMGWDIAVALTLVGLTAGALVLLTGRIWGAVLVHVVYNGTFVLLALAGTLLA